MKRWSPIVAVLVLWLCVSPARGDERGWQYLVEKLVADGVDRDRVVAVFHDWRVDPFAGIEFSANPPRESRARYFAGHGWRHGLPPAERRAVVWQYNRSDAYVDTVLILAARIGAAPADYAKKSAPRAHSKHRQQRAGTSQKRKATG